MGRKEGRKVRTGEKGGEKESDGTKKRRKASSFSFFFPRVRHFCLMQESGQPVEVVQTLRSNTEYAHDQCAAILFIEDTHVCLNLCQLNMSKSVKLVTY